MEPVPVLNVLEGPLTGKTYEVTAAGLCIGREPTCEIVVTDAGVSRQHARVLLHNGMVWVQDVGSRNGVFVNGNRVPDHKQIKAGDKVSVGINIFQLAMQTRTNVGPTSPPAPVPPAGSNRLVIGLVVAAVLLGSGTLAIFLLTR
jgi:pSer/pThr/pTyr-binding forkhead associated (FHA) protein